MATSKQVLDIARSQIGYVEQPTNRTKYGKAYGMDGSPWCDMFVWWCGHQAGAERIIGKFAYTPSHADWFKKQGRWGHKPYVGAIVFFNFGLGRISHVGIVEAVRSDGRIVVIEGNTSRDASGNQRNGGEVCRKVRGTGNVVGYGYPKYDKPAAKPPVKPIAKPKPKPVPKLMPVLKSGAKGAAVKTLQAALNKRGAHLGVDGSFGPHTVTAVKAFQKVKKLGVDGVVGPKTWKALGY